MQAKILGLFLLCSILLQSCTNKYSEQTRSFQQYLGSVFHEKIPENQHIYLLIAQFRCEGCVERTLDKLADKLSKNPKTGVSIITYNEKLIPVSLTRKVEVLLDKNSGYETIQSIANIAFIKTDRGKILSIKMMNLDDSDQIIEEEF